jgi:hypothetical protein
MVIISIRHASIGKNSSPRWVWRYQRGNQNPQIKERQTAQTPKEKRTNNDLQSNTQKTKDRATRTPIKIRGEQSVARSLVYCVMFCKSLFVFPLAIILSAFFDLRLLITFWQRQTILEPIRAKYSNTLILIFILETFNCNSFCSTQSYEKKV